MCSCALQPRVLSSSLLPPPEVEQPPRGRVSSCSLSRLVLARRVRSAITNMPKGSPSPGTSPSRGWTRRRRGLGLVHLAAGAFRVIARYLNVLKWLFPAAQDLQKNRPSKPSPAPATVQSSATIQSFAAVQSWSPPRRPCRGRTSTRTRSHGSAVVVSSVIVS